MTTTADGVGPLVRRWRERRHRSQLDVSIAADVSTRHLSFIETGRSTPSRDMIERLCDELDVPLRERNAFHLAAGLAPPHRARPLADLGAARVAIDAVLAGHGPNPAVAVDSRWDLLAANDAMWRFLTDIPAELAGPPLNMLRATMHPDGLASLLQNPAQWRAHVLRRVRRQWERTDDPALADLLAELESYPAPPPGGDVETTGDDIAVPMRLTTEFGDLALLYTVTVFGSPRDVTLDEIAIETFFPADDATRRILVAAGGGA
ncbi:helix-turn-helix domain-containing protein [Occultella gossypii]|uniref:Helix-turn-helix transcriptional regulator n=1 Tax=Occultella gossypii TaxID=2800820 RepID=A0ABS7S8A8_9MICO|nr:helix-turn-helix transcriptional regulator [Occultella gossypii]MBZ2196537.1 helix-turn-helix transcriptional regulator [Occultella gossypii]